MGGNVSETRLVVVEARNGCVVVQYSIFYRFIFFHNNITKKARKKEDWGKKRRKGKR